MVHQDGEQDVARRFGERGLDGAKRGARLVGMGVRREDGLHSVVL